MAVEAAKMRARFGVFTLDAGARSLCGDGEAAAIPLTPKEFDTLLALVEADGQAVDKEELVRRVWPETFVGDSSLARNISVLRRHLGADAIETLPKHGYRFAWPVTWEPRVVGREVVGLESRSLGVAEQGVGHESRVTGGDGIALARHRSARTLTLPMALLCLLAMAVGGWLWSRQRTAVAIRIVDPSARSAFLTGRARLDEHTVPGYYKALEEFNDAIRIDPRYAQAYAAISETYINLANNTTTKRSYAYAKQSALTAIRLDEKLAEAHRNLAWILFNDEADLEGAEREYQRALQLNPNDARARGWYAQLLIALRQPDAALREARAALDLDPLSLGTNYNYGFILLGANQPRAALDHLQKLLPWQPESEVIYGYMAMAYDQLHEYGLAEQAFQKAMDLSGLKYQYETGVAYAAAKNGDLKRAARIMNDLQHKTEHGVWVPAASMTVGYIGLGNQDRAMEWLQRCVDDHSCTLLEINMEPIHGALSGDARWEKITCPLRGAKDACAKRASQSKVADMR